jgi:hypothetical protein
LRKKNSISVLMEKVEELFRSPSFEGWVKLNYRINTSEVGAKKWLKAYNGCLKRKWKFVFNFVECHMGF